MNNIFEKISLILILLKMFHIYLCLLFAASKKIAISHLWHAMEPQTLCLVIVNDNVAEQHFIGKYCNCNSFGVTMDLLKSQNFKWPILS